MYSIEGMTYTRIYSDTDGESKLEDIQVDLQDNGMIGLLSETFEVIGLQFRENAEDYKWDFHTAPARQFIILLDGEIEIETSLGVVRRFKGGEVLLVEDVSGKGHRTRNITRNLRRSLFIKLKSRVI